MNPTPLNDIGARIEPEIISGRDVAIVDLTKPDNEYRDAILSTGHRRISDGAYSAPPGQALHLDLQRLLRASGSGDPVEIWLLGAGFYWEKTGADFIPIVNFFTYGQTGNLKCDALITIKRGPAAKKVEIEHAVPMTNEGMGAGDHLYRTASRNCYSGLLPIVAKRIAVELDGMK